MSTEPIRLRANVWLVMAVLYLGLFITLLDLTIVNVAIPSIIDSLSASLDQILWVLNAYSLVYTVLLISSGRLGDIVGPRNLFAGGMALFVTASALSGLAHDPVQLILARALQGMGAAMMGPQLMPLTMTLLPPDKRGVSFGLTGALGGLAVAVGPTLGGFIVTHWGWRWIFYVNLPLGIIALALALWLVPDVRPGRRHRLDLGGVLLLSAGLLGVVFGLIEGQRYNWGAVWSWVSIPFIIGAGLAILVVFLVGQALRQSREPLLPFVLFHDRNFTLMAFVLAVMGFSLLGLFLPLTIYFQSVLGLSAQNAGLTVAIMPLTTILVAPIGGMFAGRYGGKVALIPGLTFFGLGMAWLDLIARSDSGRWSFAPALIVAGAGMGGIWAPIFDVAMRTIEPRLAGVAGGVLETIQELGGVVASAAIGALLQNRLATALHDQAVQRAAALPPAARPSFVAGFSHAASAGLEVGRGQTGGGLHLPAGLPAGVVQQIQLAAHAVFTHGFVDAMRPSLVVPIAAILVAAVSCFAVRGGTDSKAQEMLWDSEETVA